MSDQVEVKITGLAITARYGTLSTGTILRTDAAFARHLVEECQAAEYVQPAEAPVTARPAPQATTRKKKAATAAPEETQKVAAAEQPADIQSTSEVTAAPAAGQASE